ncbi:MAG: GyrI-like domain-containing protein [Lachnospiraceae bacterium]|nr:GyrI-like domain-containing protein [Lachnospiraceae bacterium]
MEYEVVTLQEKILVGVSATTGNSDPKMGAVIGELWRKLYQDGISGEIQNKANAYAIGLYSDYQGEQYCVTVGHEVTKAENENLTTKVIPAGKYAKFFIHGDMQKAVADAWGTIWQMNLERSYAADFEEYLNCVDGEADINLYIALR